MFFLLPHITFVLFESPRPLPASLHQGDGRGELWQKGSKETDCSSASAVRPGSHSSRG